MNVPSSSAPDRLAVLVHVFIRISFGVFFGVVGSVLTLLVAVPLILARAEEAARNYAEEARLGAVNEARTIVVGERKTAIRKAGEETDRKLEKHRVRYTFYDQPIHRGDEHSKWMKNSILSFEDDELSTQRNDASKLEIPKLPAGARAVAVWISHVGHLQELPNSFDLIDVKLDPSGRSFFFDVRSRHKQIHGRALIRIHFLYRYH